METDRKILLLGVMVLLMITFCGWFWNILPQSENWLLLDYQNHFKQMENPADYSGAYPVSIYALYPFFPASWFLHLSLILPLLVYFYAEAVNKKGFQAFMIYFFSLQYIAIMGVGVLKEVIIIEFVLLGLIVMVEAWKRKLFWVSYFTLAYGVLFILTELEQPSKIISSLFLKGYNNFYFMSVWGCLFTPLVINELVKWKTPYKYYYIFGLIIILITGLFFENRLFNLAFFLQLPVIAKIMEGGLNERLGKLFKQN